jgi:outer membrane protein OmpA-like peptidoglycan-associated protein
MIVGGAAVVLAGLQYQYNIIPIRASKEAAVPLSVELHNEPVARVETGNVGALELPGFTATKSAGPFISVNMYAWTAQLGLIYANGGVQTTSNSLMEKNGVKVKLVTQPDLNKSQTAQIKFAERVHSGDMNPSGDVAALVIMMGDGSAQYLAGINKALERLGPEYKAEIVGAIGYSGNQTSGEDACMGPAEWQEDPSKARGKLIAGYLRDGDWNLCLYWAQQNGLLNNPDETTLDLDAINWLSTDDHLKAAQSYITGYCEDRRLVSKGKVQTTKQNVCVEGVATWTPGDVNIAKQKGGLVKLISTKENAYQMPAVVIGIHKWNVSNSKKVEGFLKAAFDGGDQVKTYPEALNRAGKAAFEVYGEETPTYWVKYYKGSVERDKTNRPVPLGGSRVANLGDNLVLFGLVEGAGDLNSSMWKATYEGFGKIAQQQYPKLVPTFPSVADATNLQFLQALAEKAGPKLSPEVPTYDTGGSITEVVAKRNYNIEFATGSAAFTPQATKVLDDIYNQLVIGKLSVEISGHTDNTGSPTTNTILSQARAKAVEDYLRQRAPSLFTTGRVSSQGFGPNQPVADNNTAEGRAKNRRVTIVLGNK